MNGVIRLCRRALLRVMALGVPGLMLGAAAEATHERNLLAAAQSLLPDRLSADAIATAFLAEHPGQAARASALLASLHDAHTHEQRVAALRGRIRRDFHEGQVVWVRGWMLSLTEAQLCTLIAFRSSG